MTPERVVIVGAGLGGLRTAESLHTNGFTGAVTLIGDEQEPPYDRPPLSKQFLLGKSDAVGLRDDYGTAPFELVLGRRAIHLDVSARALQLDDGRTVDYDRLVIATGARAKPWPGPATDGVVHSLRTLGDATGLRSALRSSQTLTVIGGGFIGCEIAATARSAGLHVNLIESGPTLLASVLGPRAAHHLNDLHRQHGVRVHTGASVSTVSTGPAGVDITLDNRQVISSDHAVVAIGALPNTEWLQQSSLSLVHGGVRCDSAGRTDADNVYAVGDAATWYHPLVGEHRRVEHWTTTTEQAAAVAASICGRTSEVRSAPYFWSDQYDARIQAAGFINRSTEVLRAESKTGQVFLHTDGGAVTGVVGFNALRPVMRISRLIATHGTLDNAVEFLTDSYEINSSGVTLTAHS